MEFKIQIPNINFPSPKELEKDFFGRRGMPIVRSMLMERPIQMKPMFNPFGISKFMNEMLNNISQYDEIDINVKPKEGRISYHMKGSEGETKGEFNHKFFTSSKQDVKSEKKEKVKKNKKNKRRNK